MQFADHRILHKTGTDMIPNEYGEPRWSIAPIAVSVLCWIVVAITGPWNPALLLFAGSCGSQFLTSLFGEGDDWPELSLAVSAIPQVLIFLAPFALVLRASQNRSNLCRCILVVSATILYLGSWIMVNLTFIWYIHCCGAEPGWN
jgi:hypothetical protein